MDALQRLAPPAHAEDFSLDPHGIKRPAGEDLADGSAMKQQKLDLSDYEIEIEIESSQSKPIDTEVDITDIDVNDIHTAEINQMKRSDKNIEIVHEIDIDISEPTDLTIVEPDIDMNTENEESSDSEESDVVEQVDELDHILSGRYKIVSLRYEDEYPPADGIANTIEVAPNYEHTGFHLYFSIGEEKRIFTIPNDRPQPGSDPVDLTVDFYINQQGSREYMPVRERSFFIDSTSEVEFPEAGEIRGIIPWDMQVLDFTAERIGDLEDWDEYKVWANKRKGDGEYLDGDSTASDSSSSDGSRVRHTENLSEVTDGNFDISNTPQRLRELHMAALPWYRRIYVEDEEGYRWLRDHPESDESDNNWTEHDDMMACIDFSEYRDYDYSDDGFWSDDGRDD